MPKQLTHFTIFVGTPSDVASDVSHIKAIATEVNSLQAECQFDVVHWSEDAVSSMGKGTAQQEIDQQLHRRADVYIFLVHAHLGTPLPSGLTGTEHEFQKALEAIKSDDAVHVALFFNKSPIAWDTDAEQLKSVQKFKREIITTQPGNFQEYSSSDELQAYIRKLLMKVARDYSQRGGGDADSSISRAVNRSLSTEFVEGDESDDLGILDFQEIFETKMASSSGFLKKLPARQESLNTELNKFTDGLKYIDFAGMGAAEKKRRVETVTIKIEEFLSEIEPLAHKFSEDLKEAMNAGLMVTEYAASSGENLDEFVEIVGKTRKSMEYFHENNLSLISSIKLLPPLTVRFKKVRARLLALFDLLSEAIGSGVRLAARVEQAAKGLD